MKKIALIILCAFTNVFASDLITNYRLLIAEQWQNSSWFDSTNLGNTLIAGRCFDRGSLQPFAAALLIEQRPQDGGPLGNGSDLITYGAILINKSDVNTKYFDDLDYGDLAPYNTNMLVELSNTLEGVRLYGYDVKFNTSDNTFYAVKYDWVMGEKYFTDVCYFYKENH